MKFDSIRFKLLRPSLFYRKVRLAFFLLIVAGGLVGLSLPGRAQTHDEAGVARNSPMNAPQPAPTETEKVVRLEEFVKQLFGSVTDEQESVEMGKADQRPGWSLMESSRHLLQRLRDQSRS